MWKEENYSDFGHFNCLKIVQKERKLEQVLAKPSPWSSLKEQKFQIVLNFFLTYCLKAKMAMQVDIIGNL